MIVIWLSQDFSNKAFKKTAEKMWVWFKRLYGFINSGGKQTTIGTGSSFEILWNVEHQDGAKDEGMT